MNVKEAVQKFLNYQKEKSVADTVENYRTILSSFQVPFGECELENLTPEENFSFLNERTEKCKQRTKRLRFAQLKAFFNFCIGGLNLDFVNPCKNPLFARTYKEPKLKQREVITKEVIDEIIFKTEKLRDRLLLELQARSGLRVGEVLKLRPKDIEGRKVTLNSPKSGRESEMAFLPLGLGERLSVYIRQKNIRPEEKIFPFTYSSAREIVKKAGRLVGIHLKIHDLRRHSATYASRNGVPLEVISKVILRHQDLRTTQIYLGKVGNEETLHWMDTLHGR